MSRWRYSFLPLGIPQEAYYLYKMGVECYYNWEDGNLELTIGPYSWSIPDLYRAKEDVIQARDRARYME